MKADNEFLMALANKLSELAEKTNDYETRDELNEFVEVVLKSLSK